MNVMVHGLRHLGSVQDLKQLTATKLARLLKTPVVVDQNGSRLTTDASIRPFVIGRASVAAQR